MHKLKIGHSYLIFGFVYIALLTHSCASNGNASDQTINEQSLVAIIVEIKNSNGEVLFKPKHRVVEAVQYGSSKIPEFIWKQLIGKKAGEELSMQIDRNQFSAYFGESKQIRVSKDEIPPGYWHVGAQFLYNDWINAAQQARVIEITEDEAVIELNSYPDEQSLIFNVYILSVQNF